MTAIALTIAGSDSSGGAGIQADLKTFSALGVYGASAITALTAQNTQGVEAVLVVPPDFVARQIKVVARDLKVGAVKIGMLATSEVIEAVAGALEALPGVPVVLDPVMVAASEREDAKGCFFRGELVAIRDRVGVQACTSFPTGARTLAAEQALHIRYDQSKIRIQFRNVNIVTHRDACRDIACGGAVKLHPVRRVVTGLDAEGRSTVAPADNSDH